MRTWLLSFGSTSWIEHELFLGSLSELELLDGSDANEKMTDHS